MISADERGIRKPLPVKRIAARERIAAAHRQLGILRARACAGDPDDVDLIKDAQAELRAARDELAGLG